MNDDKLLNIFTITGGAGGGSISAISQTGLIECIIFAAVGALVGWLVKKLLDYIFKKIKEGKFDKKYMTWIIKTIIDYIFKKIIKRK